MGWFQRRIGSRDGLVLEIWVGSREGLVLEKDFMFLDGLNI